jgi:hypothetical protein
MNDGSAEDFPKNDVMLLPPGHDAWAVGDEPCVSVEFSRGNDLYSTTTKRLSKAVQILNNFDLLRSI